MKLFISQLIISFWLEMSWQNVKKQSRSTSLIVHDRRVEYAWKIVSKQKHGMRLAS